MARVKQNMFVRGLSGMVGKSLVFRHMKDGTTILSVKPDFSQRVFSEGQLSHQRRFQKAVAYARTAAKTNPRYAELAKGTLKTAYNIALSDWFDAPVIHAVRRQGDLIEVEATDNVAVAKVLVSVLDDEGGVLEQGEAVPQGNQVWGFTVSASGRVRVEVWDFAGNVAREE